MKIKEKENSRQKLGNGLFIPYFSPEILVPGSYGCRARAFPYQARAFPLRIRLVPRPTSASLRYEALWMAVFEIGTLLDEGWRTAYSDGTRRDDEVAAAFRSQDRRGNPDASQGCRLFLDPKATVADGQ